MLSAKTNMYILPILFRHSWDISKFIVRVRELQLVSASEKAAVSIEENLVVRFPR